MPVYLKRLFPFVSIVIVFLFVGFYNLDNVPGEWFGDISNLHEYVVDIQAGKWPISYRQTVGPLYHYLITPFVSLTPQRYIDYKILSLLSGMLSLSLVMLASTIICNKKVGLFTGILMGFSFWFITWSRLGNLHAIIPGLIVSVLLLEHLYLKTRKTVYLILGALCSWLGIFLYIPLVLLPLVFFFSLWIQVSFISTYSIKRHIRRMLYISFVGSCIVFIPLLFFVIKADPLEFFSSQGNIGGKFIPLFSLSFQEIIQRFFLYFSQTIGMFFIKGDPVFRVNVPYSPILDHSTALMFLLGFIVQLRTNKKQFLLFFIPFIVFLLPASFPSLNPLQVPSSTRTIPVLPIVFMWAGQGIYFLFYKFSDSLKLFILLILLLIVGMNLYTYFEAYPKMLPNGNAAYGKSIAQYIDTHKQFTSVWMSDCCFLEWREVDPKAIYYQLYDKKGKQTVLEHIDDSSCSRLQKPFLMIDKPDNQTLLSCHPSSVVSYKDKQGKRILSLYGFEK